MVPVRYSDNFKFAISELIDWYPENFKWNFCYANVTGPHFIIDQHWFRQWLGAIRQQAITWTTVDPDLFPHIVSSDHKEFKLITSAVYFFPKSVCTVRTTCNILKEYLMWVHFTTAIGHHLTKAMQLTDLGNCVIEDMPGVLNVLW